MRLPRLTTRRLMVLVAVVGIALWCNRLRVLSEDYRRKARSHEGICWEYDLTDPKAMELTGRRQEYNRALRENYEHAARYPWLPVPPDPPRPD